MGEIKRADNQDRKTAPRLDQGPWDLRRVVRLHSALEHIGGRCPFLIVAPRFCVLGLWEKQGVDPTTPIPDLQFKLNTHRIGSSGAEANQDASPTRNRSASLVQVWQLKETGSTEFGSGWSQQPWRPQGRECSLPLPCDREQSGADLTWTPKG